MIAPTAILSTASTNPRWPRWPLILALSVLFFGPPAAALFIATGLPLARDLGWLARDLLTTYICPTPAKSYELFHAPMAVCARCWGATIGLWVGYGLVRQSAASTAPHLAWLTKLYTLPWIARLLFAALPFLGWVAEIALWPSAPYWFLLLNGIQAGIGAGLFFCSIWPGMVMNDRTAQSVGEN